MLHISYIVLRYTHSQDNHMQGDVTVTTVTAMVISTVLVSVGSRFSSSCAHAEAADSLFKSD